MKNKLRALSPAGVACIVMWVTASTRADEGLWLFSSLPRQQLKEKHAVELSDTWLEHLQKSCARIGGGGSGAFVSADGLIVTNHHVGLRWFAYLPGGPRRLVENGFYAAGRAQEIKCPGLEVKIPWESEDVSGRVQGALKPGMSLAAAHRARRAVLHAIEKESQEKTGLASEVDALYHGAGYRLVRYRTYADVRLVFAPEYVASRLIDCCFFRVYEAGRPATIKRYLRWGGGEPRLGDLVFIAGFPRETNRFLAADHLDVLYGRPLLQKLKWLARTEQAMDRFANESALKAWEAWTEQRSMKEAVNRIWYFLGPPLEGALASKRALERTYRDSLAKQPNQLKRYRDAQEKIAQLVKDLDTLNQPYFFLESGSAFNSQLFTYARTLVRLAHETAKPDADRLPEYTQARLKHEKHRLLAPREIGTNLEQVKLTESLSMFAAWAGNNDELVLRVLAGKTPRQRARQLVQESKLDDAAVRKQLAEGGKKALDDSSDPMIELARLVDGPARKVRLAWEEKVQEPSRQAYAAMAALRAGAQDRETYPDATGSLRLSFGRVRQQDEQTAQFARIKDIFTYLYVSKREGEMPTRWAAAQNRLDGDTRIWLSSSADVAPGNSGSPVVDRAGRLVGVAALSNSHVHAVAYQEGSSGNHAVSTSGIAALLEVVYDAGNLTKELAAPPVKKLAAKNSQNTAKSGAPATGSSESRYQPATAGTGIAKRHKNLLPALIKALKDADKEVVQSVTTALGNIGADAVPSLVQALESPDPTLRARAAIALGKTGSAGQEAIPALVKALQDKELEVRREAARAIALIVTENPALRSSR